ncbi:MAG: PAS domain-containing sensor histidine kinase, partial [Halobacteriales archaeon]|nr:PAS domain-containing sensor histidine kinase [Halobacteriales archaeon]
LYTGQGSEGIAERAIAAGVTDYLQKRPGTSQYTLLANRIRNAVQQHRLERELERTAQRTAAQFDLLVGAVEDYAIFLLDEDGYIRTWNAGAEQIKGYTSEEIIGEHFSTFYTEDDVDAGIPERNLREATTEGRTRDEGWRVRKDGTEFWADVTITALRRGDDLLGYAKITHDSTERHHKQVLLEQNEQLKDLIAAISHDLRGPLTVAGGNVELAHETGDLSHLETATGALDRASELLDYLGTLAKEGRRVMDPEPVDLREVTRMSWDVIETNGAELDVEGSVTLVADRQRLQELLENLLKNAVEHGSTSPRSQAHDDSAERSSASSRTKSDDAVEHAEPDVVVRVGPLDDGGFYVEDDGPGIPETQRDEIFEVESSEKGGGSGFGLAICEQIAGAHGWTIDVTDGTDGGARFEISGIELG